ncbi:MAG: DegT/DnrJ/EryC1/StrS family aminotransferase [Clostridia bacterium]|nr:DegT/DnrJ/EryC1/StrS family aminotransferase [Clostridia bacterium]
MTTRIPTVNGSSVVADGILSDKRFEGIAPFENKVWLSSPTMHGEEMAFVKEAIETNWVSTVGKNINELEKAVASYLGMKDAVALSCGTAALHMCMKLAAERLNPSAKPGNSLEGQKVFCSDMTFDASVNPIVYEGGEPIFIDTEKDTWNMDPESLEKAFELYPDVKIVVLAHLYGVPAKMDEIVSICRKHSALIIEDAAEALGARYDGKVVSGMCGSFGDFSAISFNGNKIITGSSGGMFVTNCTEDAHKVRKWSTQSREDAPWYQHEELGYNYRMSNIIAGVARGNMLHIDEHIRSKKEIYERYKEGLKDLPVIMNPFESKSTPNYWLSCCVIDEDAMEPQVRSGKHYLYKSESGKSCPQEILEALAVFRAEGRPIWKPMHMQPIYRMNGFVVKDGSGRARSNAYIDEENIADVGMDIFKRGLCLPSDNKMTKEQQDVVIEIIHRCFQ